MQELIVALLLFPEGLINEPRCEKTGLRGFRPGPTQTELYSHRQGSRNFRRKIGPAMTSSTRIKTSKTNKKNIVAKTSDITI